MSDVVLLDVLRRRAADSADRLFIEEVGGARRSYGELYEITLRWAHAFERVGVSAGDTVLSLLPSSLTIVEAWLGMAWLKAIEVPVHTAYRGRMLAHVIRDSRASVLLIEERFLDRLEELGPALDAIRTVVVVGDASRAPALAAEVVPVQRFLDGAQTDERAVPEAHDTSMIIYTSGTTGASKGVVVPWEQYYGTTTGALPYEDLGEDDAYYLTLPMFHMSGKLPLGMMAMRRGRIAMRESFKTDEYWSDIKRHGATVTAMMGAMANFLYQQPERPEDRETPLRHALMMPLIPDLARFCERFGVRVATVFNMSELSVPIASGWNPSDLRSCGRVRDGYACRVVDEWDREVAPGTIGELIVRADRPWRLMAGYWGNAEKTVEAWRNQWFHTGDAFKHDADGNFYFVDRIKDAIRRRGENISSMEVEAEVNEHPAVIESAAIGVASDVTEEELKVVVVTVADATLGEQELVDHLRERLPRFMVPRYVELCSALPKTPTERVRKTELRDDALNARTWDAEAGAFVVPAQ